MDWKGPSQQPYPIAAVSDLSKRAGEKKDVTIPPRSAWASSPMATHATMVPRSLPLLHPKQRDMKSRVHDRQHPGELLNSNVIMRAGATRTAAVIRWPGLQFAGLQHKTGPTARAESCLLAAAASAGCKPTERATTPASVRSRVHRLLFATWPRARCMMMISIVVQTRWNPISTGGSRLENAMARLARSTQRHLELAMLAIVNNVDC